MMCFNEVCKQCKNGFICVSNNKNCVHKVEQPIKPVREMAEEILFKKQREGMRIDKNEIDKERNKTDYIGIIFMIVFLFGLLGGIFTMIQYTASCYGASLEDVACIYLVCFIFGFIVSFGTALDTL